MFLSKSGYTTLHPQNKVERCKLIIMNYKLCPSTKAQDDNKFGFGNKKSEAFLLHFLVVFYSSTSRFFASTSSYVNSLTA